MQKINSLLGRLDEVEIQLTDGIKEMTFKAKRQAFLANVEKEIVAIERKYKDLETKNDRLKNRQAKRTGKMKLKSIHNKIVQIVSETSKNSSRQKSKDSTNLSRKL